MGGSDQVNGARLFPLPRLTAVLDDALGSAAPMRGAAPKEAAAGGANIPLRRLTDLQLPVCCWRASASIAFGAVDGAGDGERTLAS